MTDYDLEIQEEKPDHHFRTEIPNIISDMVEIGELSHYDAMTYFTLKRICGDAGKSFYSIPNIAKKCGFSEDTVRKSLKKLSQEIPLIGSILIKIQKRLKQDGSADSSLITIVNIWRKNGNFYRERKEIKKCLGGSSDQPGVVVGTNQGGSWERDKEEPLKKNHIEEEQLTVCNAHVREGEQSPPDLFFKKSLHNEDVRCDRSELTRRCIQERKDYASYEMQEAWHILWSYQHPVTDYFRFVCGTIDKNREKTKFEEKKCYQKNNRTKSSPKEPEEKKKEREFAELISVADFLKLRSEASSQQNPV